EGGEMTKSVFSPGKPDDALGLEPRQGRLADFAVHHSAGMAKIAKQEGDVEDRKLWRDRGEHRRRRKGHLKRAGGDVLAHFQLAAGFAGRIELNPQPAAAIFLDIG